MNEIRMYLKPSGSTAELYKDFNLYKDCFRNAQFSVCVPKSLLFVATNFTNAVKIGAILTAQNGKKVTTESYFLSYVADETRDGIVYAKYTRILPKEFTAFAGSHTVVANVISVDNTNALSPRVLAVTASQTAELTVLNSAYLETDETIEPSEAETMSGEINAIAEKAEENAELIQQIKEDLDSNFSKAVVVWGFNSPAAVSDLDWEEI